MKKLLALALVALMAGSAMALPGMGMFFSPDSFTDEDTNIETTAAPFNAYLVLFSSPYETIGGYVCGITISDPGVLIISVTGTNGWTNYGDNTNHLVGYGANEQPPLPFPAGSGAVLSTLSMLQLVAAPADILLGPGVPPTIPGSPVIADGNNPDLLSSCWLTSGNDPAGGVVATLNGAGVTATESHTLSDVKALFD